MRKRRTFGLAVVVLLTSVGSTDATGLQCLFPINLAGGDWPGRIMRVVDAGDGVRLIGAVSGLYRLDPTGLHALEPATNGGTGAVWLIVEAGDGAWLIGAENGLYRLDGAGLSPLRLAGGGEIAWVRRIVDVGDGAWLIGAGSGLFRLDAAGLHALRPAEGGETGNILEIVDVGDGVRLIGADNGLFRLDAAGLHALRPADGGEIGNTLVIFDAGEGAWLIGADSGLFRLDTAGLHALRPAEGAGTGDIRGEIVDVGDGVWLIGAENGFYSFDATGLHALQSAEGGGTGDLRGEIVDAANGTRLFGTANGLYRLDAPGLHPPRPASSGGRTGRILGDIVHPSWGGTLLMPSAKESYRLDATGLSPMRSAEGRETGSIVKIADAGHGAWLIEAANGLYWLDAAEPAVAAQPATRLDALSGQTHTFAWTVQHRCVGVLPDAGLIGVRFGESDWPPAVVQRPGADGRADVVRVEVMREIPARKPGDTVTSSLWFRPNVDAPFQQIAGSETVVRVDWGPWDYSKDYLKRFGPWALGAQTVLFGALLLAARRSRAAWDVVTDPLWGKVGIQFWTLLRFWPGLQRWALARWRGALGREYPAADYLPMPLSGPKGARMTSAELAGALAPGRRIWLQGAAGMGKTALVEYAVADWCAGPGGLGAAFARWGYVPLPIALRDFADVKVPDAPEDWLFELAGRRLEAAGLKVEDTRLLRGMLTAGYWVLVLDGANEVDDKGAIQQFARRFPQVGMLVTSQAEPRAEAAGLFEVWKLPPDIRAATGPLLGLYLGPERGAEVLRRIEGPRIAEDIRSGYDVRLVADLVAGGTDPSSLPATRVDLYDAMLGAAGDGYPVGELCRVAWACWVAGRRDLKPGDNIRAELLEPLKQSGVRVVRTQDGATWQFRHDQMRAYLAARWAAVEEVSPVDLFGKTPAIWRLGKSEQQVVWEFFARLLDDDANRGVLAWADEEAERAELQVALRRAWRSGAVAWKPPRPEPADAASG